jgi:hypothetical protein
MDRLRRQEDGLIFLNRAAESLGEAHGLESTAAALLGNAVTYHLRAGRIDEALTLLNDEELTILVPRVFIEERRRETAVRDLENKVKSEPFEEALEAVDEALRNGNIDNRRWEELTPLPMVDRGSSSVSRRKMARRVAVPGRISRKNTENCPVG